MELLKSLVNLVERGVQLFLLAQLMLVTLNLLGAKLKINANTLLINLY